MAFQPVGTARKKLKPPPRQLSKSLSRHRRKLLPKLKLKWAFGYANVNAARAQPALAGGRLFVASENSEVHALDAQSGCIHWTYKAAAGVRAALSTGPYAAGGTSGYSHTLAEWYDPRDRDKGLKRGLLVILGLAS